MFQRMPNRYVVGLIAALGVAISCRMELQKPESPTSVQTVALADPAVEVPLAVEPGVVASRAMAVNLSDTVTFALPLVREASATLTAEDIVAQVDEIEEGEMPNAIVSILTSSGDVTGACKAGLQVAQFFVEFDENGDWAGVEPASVKLSAEFVAAAGDGKLSLCTMVETNFVGQVWIAGATVDFTMDGLPSLVEQGAAGEASGLQQHPELLGGNDNSDNDNDNDNGNSNGNGNSNVNGNSNSNGNTNDNSNGNTNENSNGNSNGNANSNDNGNTNGNGNSNGNSNGNVNGNSNDNDNENGNSNSNGNANDNGNTNGNGNGNDNTSGLSILSSVPSDGAIDARQPFDINGGPAQGWNMVDLLFSGDATGLTPNDFSTSFQGSGGPAPVVQSVQVNGSMATLTLSGPILPLGWTTIVHNASGTGVRLGFLPGDVNADRTAGPADILSLIDFLNGVASLPPYQTDADRSGVTNPADILRVIDLLNGANSFDSYLLAMLPPDNGNGNGNDNGNTNGNSNDNGNTNGNSNDNGNTNGNSNDNGNTNSNSNDNGNTNGNANGNSNNNANDNGNTNGNSNGNSNGNLNGNSNDNDNENSNGNSNGNTNGNSNVNGNDNGNTNGNSNGNSNGNANGNANGNSNDNGNTNGNSNGNTNGNSNGNTNGNANGNDNGNTNGNTNGNSNGNVNGNDNGGGSVCPDGDIRLSASLSGNSGQSGHAGYRNESDGRRRFELNVSGFPSGSHSIVVNNVVVGFVNVGGNGSGNVDWDTNDGNFPGNFPNIMVGATISVGGQATGSFVLNCS